MTGPSSERTAARARMIRRLGPGQYESADGRYEIAYEITWLDRECECAVCQGYIFASCPNEGYGKRDGWHIWDRETNDYAAFAYEPVVFQTYREARAALVWHLTEKPSSERTADADVVLAALREKAMQATVAVYSVNRGRVPVSDVERLSERLAELGHDTLAVLDRLVAKADADAHEIERLRRATQHNFDHATQQDHRAQRAERERDEAVAQHQKALRRIRGRKPDIEDTRDLSESAQAFVDGQRDAYEDCRAIADEALAAKGRLQHNPKPLKVVRATHRCVACRQYAPRCTCAGGPDYQPLQGPSR